jgi:hypothetical protein
MKERQKRQFRTLKAVVRFLEEHLFTDKRVVHLKQELLAHLERLTALISENQIAKSMPLILHSDPKRQAKDNLREDHLLPLSRRGRKLAREHPKLMAALKVPHKNASADEIADAAKRFADALKPHLSFLIQAGYPRNCLTVLRQEARALRADTQAKIESRRVIGRTNRELTKELSLARETINDLDSVLRSFDDFRSFATDWNVCNRVEARMGRPSKRRLAARQRSAARALPGT